MNDVLVGTSSSAATVVTVKLSGDIDHATAERLRHALVDAIMRKRTQRIEVDLLDTVGVDPIVIGTLAAAYQMACDMRQTLIFRDAGPAIRAQLAQLLAQDTAPAPREGPRQL
jgi:anti-anti-sigma regulatory factor